VTSLLPCLTAIYPEHFSMDPSDTNAFFNAGYTLRTLQAARTPDWGPTRTPPTPRAVVSYPQCWHRS